VIKSYGSRFDLAHCWSHQQASSYLAETSALNEEYNQAAYIVHRQHTGEEVHDAHGPTALNSGI